MKTMTCKQLGGACELELTAATFEEIGELSKNHAMAMKQQNDAAHIEAMQSMSELIQTPNGMQDWFEARRQEFEALPED